MKRFSANKKTAPSSYTFDSLFMRPSPNFPRWAKYFHFADNPLSLSTIFIIREFSGLFKEDSR